MEFGSKAVEKLNAAGQELVFLLNWGYDVKSASTFIGNHHLLSERQRLALARITSTKAALMERRRKELTQAPAELVLTASILSSRWKWRFPARCSWREWTAPSAIWPDCGEPTALWTKQSGR